MTAYPCIDDVVSMAGAMDDPSGAGRVETPLRLIHGELDERVPYRSSVDVFAAASASPPAHRHLTRIPIAVLTMDPNVFGCQAVAIGHFPTPVRIGGAQYHVS
jgi:fermentation-respiration switch protein FrsA (DUF1100 family)